MWHPRDPPPPPPMGVDPGEASWEDLLDSGQLDSRLQQMHIKPHFNVPPPQRMPTMFTQPPPPIPRFSGRGVASYGPGGVASYCPPGVTFPQYAVPPPQIMVQSRAPVASRPYRTQYQPAHQPPVQIIQAEDESAQVTPYCPPEPKMTILKRPQSSPSNLSSQGINGKSKTKTLKEREEEYAQARLRILGAAANPEDEEEQQTNVIKKSGGSCGARIDQEEKCASGAVRSPKGPDGSKGFQKTRQQS